MRGLRMALWLVLAFGAFGVVASAQTPPPPPTSASVLSTGFIAAAKAYYEHIRALETSKAVEMSRDDSRAYDQAREGARGAQTTVGDRTVMSLLRQYSVLVTQWRSGVVQAGRSDFRLPPERAQLHARCRTEIERSLETGSPYPNSKCTAAAPVR